MRTTRTYALLDVSSAVFAEVEAKLKAAGYDHAFHKRDDADGWLIDMTGIALQEADRAV